MTSSGFFGLRGREPVTPTADPWTTKSRLSGPATQGVDPWTTKSRSPAPAAPGVDPWATKSWSFGPEAPGVDPRATKSAAAPRKRRTSGGPASFSVAALTWGQSRGANGCDPLGRRGDSVEIVDRRSTPSIPAYDRLRSGSVAVEVVDCGPTGLAVPSTEPAARLGDGSPEARAIR